MDGGKARRAAELGTKVVHPDVYEVMLTYLQPSLPRTCGSARPASPRQPEEALVSAEGSIGTPVVAPSVGGCPDLAAPNPAHVRSWARANGPEAAVRPATTHIAGRTPYASAMTPARIAPTAQR